MTENEKKRVSELRSAGLGYTAISKQLSISVNTVKSYCRRNSLPSLKATKTCEQCGKPIVQNPKYKPKRFCCDACRNKWWNSHLHLVKRKAIYTFTCPACGREFQKYGEKRVKYCSHQCYINDRFGGKDGRSNVSDNYVLHKDDA